MSLIISMAAFALATSITPGPVNFGQYARITQDSYYLVDLMARYRFNEHLSTTLNVKNLFDKKYYTGLGNFGTGFYGEPRSLQLATKWDF
jgi:outer membrane receptor for ferric coprogen and ferric-rhodotorulic acid